MTKYFSASELNLIEGDKKALREVYKIVHGIELKLGDELLFLRDIETQINNIYRYLDNAYNIMKDLEKVIENRKKPGTHSSVPFDPDLKLIKGLVSRASHEFSQVRFISNRLYIHEEANKNVFVALKNICGKIDEDIKGMENLIEAYEDEIKEINE